MYSGPIAGHGYAAVRAGDYDVVVLVGPSHYTAFNGVAVAAGGAFESPLGALSIDESLATSLAGGSDLMIVDADVHAREHSLEMQLPFLARVLPGVPIVPMIIGAQRPAVTHALGDLLAAHLEGRRALLVASSDLSHFLPRSAAIRLDERVLDCLAGFDADGLDRALNEEPNHACGGGAMVSVLRAARALGADSGAVLKYGDSGDVSGDTDSVVGYVSAAFGKQLAALE
jgi:AmmeMemoRadiSam system protein B